MLLLVAARHPATFKPSQAVSKLQRDPTFHENRSNSPLVVNYLVQRHLHSA